ncbi:uncharacterized protein LOC110720177 [Chenopodium quinoa]|uniref:uncharacterized protein LOC110720177 n=1 Tax=Chenopodium quinoa TaxID=63459 RepID=UPI000B777268|nr:uncharacterized protein LOC110720177 [Chenopodium quinoa]
MASCRPVVYDKNSYYGTEQAKINQHGVSEYSAVYKHEDVVAAGAPKHNQHHHEQGIIGKITGMFHKKKKNREGRCHDGSSSSSSDSDSDHERCEPRKRCD